MNGPRVSPSLWVGIRSALLVELAVAVVVALLMRWL